MKNRKTKKALPPLMVIRASDLNRMFPELVPASSRKAVRR